MKKRVLNTSSIVRFPNFNEPRTHTKSVGRLYVLHKFALLFSCPAREFNQVWQMEESISSSECRHALRSNENRNGLNNTSIFPPQVSFIRYRVLILVIFHKFMFIVFIQLMETLRVQHQGAVQLGHISVTFRETGHFVTSLLMLNSQVCRINILVRVSGLLVTRKDE